MPATLRAAVIAMALVIAVIPAFAQSGGYTATLTGIVLNEEDRPLSGAQLTVLNEDTNRAWDVMSGPDGRFTMQGLPPGPYRLIHGSAVATDPLSLTINTPLDVVFRIRVAGVVETVEVAAPRIDPGGTSGASVISGVEIQNLPLNRRDFKELALLAPGVASDRTPQQGSSATSGLIMAGQRARSNSMLVDGLDNNDTAVGGVRAVFSGDAVREFQVLTNSYSAEFGRASGGVVNVVIRSGGNQLAGSAFAFLRDDALNARDYFERFTPSGQPIDRAKAPYSQKQFGGTAGGPLRRDRTFFFASFERLDVQANNFVTINDRDGIGLFGQPLGTAVDVLRRAGFVVETGDVPYSVTSSQLLGKVDHHFDGHNLDVRVNWGTDRNENSEPWGGQVARSRGGVLESDDVVVAASHTTFKWQKILNELRSQVAYRGQNVLALDPRCSGPCDGEDEGGPTLELTGVASVGRHRFSPQPRKTVRYQFLDTVSLQRGAMFWKFGADYNYIDHPSGALPLHFGGRYIFAPLPAIPGLLPQPISSIQALALGLPAAYVQGYGNSAAQYAVQDLSLFAQNDWRPMSGLTVKLGARYQAQLLPAIEYRVRGLDPYSFPSSHNVAPRLGLAWTPSADQRWSLHAAYGIFHDIQLTTLPGVTDIVDGSADGVRTLVLRFPATIAAWNAPGHRLPESALGTSFPSLAITVDPRLKTPYAHHASLGLRRDWPQRLSLAVDGIYARGHNQVGTLDYNPVVPELGADRRPDDDVRGGVAVPGTSASVLQYTSFGETWYRGLTMSLTSAPNDRYALRASYTVSKTEDNTTDYQNGFIPEDTGKGRDRSDPTGLPLGFDPLRDKGPSLQDQRHRLVLSGSYRLPLAIDVSPIVAIGSGRPYNILAGVDLNGDGNGGAFPPDRARRNPRDPASSVTRNSGTLPMQATTDIRVSRRFVVRGYSVDGNVEIFNLWNRANFTEINSVFGAGAYPSEPLPAFGQFEKAGPPLQVQLALRVNF